jgi:hypothetical protein
VHDEDGPDVRHRGGTPWYVAQIPRRWHSCRPQTVRLHRANGSLTGICHCACGALTDRTGRWIGGNSRRRTPARPVCIRIPQRRSLSSALGT